jgi:GntR family transcriptional regulator / MocR family aminotransferase
MSGKYSGALIALLDRQPVEGQGVAVRIQKALRQMIVDGVIRQRERLPSTRTLATDLGVARDTVEAAYRHLEAEGFVDRRHGSGTFAAALERNSFLGTRTKVRTRKAGRIRPETSLSKRGKDIWKRGGVIDQTVALPFAAAMPDVKPFPVDIWRQITARVLRSGGPSILMYGDPQGYLALREEIANYLAVHRGVRCNEGQVVLLSSSQQALSLIANLLVDQAECIAIEDPGYHGAKSAFAAAGIALFPIPVDAQGLQVGELRNRNNVRAVYVTPSHQYPMGVSLSLKRRLALIDWAQRNRGWIIEDDYDSEYRYDGRPLSSIQGLDAKEHVLYTGTFSKVLFPSLRLAYLVLPETLVPAFVTARTLMDGQSSLINQIVLSQFIADGHFTAHIRRMRQLYRARRDAFLKSFDKHLSRYATVLAPSGGLQAACLLNEGLDEAETAKLAVSAGVELPTLRRLYIGPKPRSGWLLGFAALTPGVIEDAMHRFALKLASSQSVR